MEDEKALDAMAEPQRNIRGPPSPSSAISRGAIAKAREALMTICESIDPFAKANLSKAVLLQKISKLVGFLKSDDVLNNVAELDLDYSRIFTLVRPLLITSDTLVRACCFRLFRHFLLEIAAIDSLIELRIHIFVIFSLEYEGRHVLERMEALKLCRRIIDLECSLLPKGIVRSFVAIANLPEDPFRNVILETLRQLAVRNTAIVAQCDGIRAIVNAIVDPSLQEMSQTLTLTVLYLLGQHSTRKYIRPSLDMAALLSPLTDSDVGDQAEARLRWKACQNAIILFFKTWTGLFYLTSDPSALRAVIQMLVQPVCAELREAILNTILHVFLHLAPYDFTISKEKDDEHACVAPDSATNGVSTTGFTPNRSTIHRKPMEGLGPPQVDYWGIGPNSLGARMLTAYGYSTEYFPKAQTEPHAVMNQFLAVVLLAFTGCGLVDVLMELIVVENEPLSRIAAQLLSFLMRISEHLFPGSRHLKQFSLSDLVEKATQFLQLQSHEPVEKLGARRAARVLSLFSKIVGFSFDSTVSTIRAKYTYEDAVALCSELGLSTNPISEHERQNIGIFPRGDIASLPYTPHLIVALLTDPFTADIAQSHSTASSPVHRALSPSGTKESPSNRRSKIISSIRSPSSLLSKTKRAERRILHNEDQSKLIQQKMADTYEVQQRQGLGDIAGRTLVTALDENPLASRPTFAASNRGHRRQVRTMILTDHVYSDLNEMSVRVFQSQVLQGKDWTKWDWEVVDEIVSGSMRHRAQCLEIMKTKFVKRIMGFFRATTIGEFLVLPWKPKYQPYTNVAISLIHVLLCIPEGVEFLRYDRRGKVHRQILEALKAELQYNDGSRVNMDNMSSMLTSSYFTVGGRRDASLIEAAMNELGASGGPVTADVGASQDFATRIFSPIACSRSMTRDFFPILGAYTSHDAGIELMEESNLFGILTDLSRLPSKDYILRLVIPYLDYVTSDKCRNWLQMLLLQQICSNDLILYILGFIRGLLRREHVRVNGPFARWLLQLLYAVLHVGGAVTSSAISILNEAVYYEAYLKILASLDLAPLEPFLDLHFARPLFFKLLSSSPMFRALKSKGWVDKLAKEWHVEQGVKYAARIETLMTLKLLCRNEPMTCIPRSYEKFHVDIQHVAGEAAFREALDDAIEKTFGCEAASKNAARQIWSSSHHNIGFNPLRIPIRGFEASAVSEPGFSSTDLLSLVRLPWTVELWLKTRDGKMTYIPVQSYLDCSHVTGPEFGVAELDEMTAELKGKSTCGTQFGSKWNETIHRDLCVIATPYNGTLKVPTDAYLYACLTLAGDPILRNGVVQPAPSSDGAFSVPFGTRARRASSVTAKPPPVMWMADGATIGIAQTGRHVSEEFLDYNVTTRESFTDIDDDTFWIKCGPQHLEFHSRTGNEDTTESTDSEASSRGPRLFEKEAIFSICPGSNATATFSFEQKERQITLLKVSFHMIVRPDCPNAPFYPSHFFGELARTPFGAEYLKEKGYIHNLLDDLVRANQPFLAKRSVLWSIGHIASSEAGLSSLLEQGRFLRDSEGRPIDVMKVITDIAVGSDSLPLRGTAVTILGLFSRTQRGRLLLRDCGWETQASDQARYGFVVVPKSFSMMFRSFQEGEPRRVWDGLSSYFSLPSSEHTQVDDLDPVVVSNVLEAVSKLMNQISIKEAHGAILRLRARHPEAFQSPVMLLHVHEYLSNFSYQLWVRRFLLKNFHRSVPFERSSSWDAFDKPLS